MPTRHFEGPTIDVLLERVRNEIGTDARIVRAQKVRKGGIFGFFARELFELTVEVPAGSATRRRGRSSPAVVASGRASRTPARATNPGTAVERGGAPPVRTNSPAPRPAGRSPRRGGTGRAAAPRGSAARTGARGAGPFPPSPVDPSRRPASRGANDLVRRRYGAGDLPAAPEGGGDAAASDLPTAAGLYISDQDDFAEGLSRADLGTEFLESDGLSDSGLDHVAGGLTGDMVEDFRFDAASGHTARLLADPENLGSAAARYWSYFLVPPSASGGSPRDVHGDLSSADDHSSRASAEPPADDESGNLSARDTISSGGPTDLRTEGDDVADSGTPVDVVDLTHPVPSTESPTFADVVGSIADTASRPARVVGRALERAPLPFATDYLDDLRAMGADEVSMVGEAPALPPEVIQILSRMTIAGMLPRGASEGDPDGDGSSVRDLGGEVGGIWSRGMPRWRPEAAALGPGVWGHVAGPVPRRAPGDVFASTPFLPAGLSSIGFPAALIPAPDTCELVARLIGPDTDFDGHELARNLFLEALRAFPSAPELPEGAGRLVAVIGELSAARRVAAKLAVERGVDAAEVVIAAPEGELGDVPAWMLIPSEEIVAKRRPRWKAKDEVTFVAVSSSLISTNRDWARGILESLQPDLVFGVVEATHKAEDIASWAIELGHVDCLAIEGGRATRTPAAVLACGIPVSLIDGQEADFDLWSRIVTERLAIC